MIVKIKRQKEPDAAPYWQSFSYDGPKHVTVSAVLDALNYTDDLFDTEGKPAPRIRWECSCMQAVCGGCGMVINGVPALACATFADEVKADTLVLEPLSKFPVIADLNTKVSTLYGMLQPNVSSTQAVRAVFVIDPEGIIRSIIYYPLTTGRNFDEIKRMIQALQKSDETHNSTPANWQPGDDLIISTPVTVSAAEAGMASTDENEYALDWFLRFRKDRT